MGAVSESIMQRMTLGHIVEHYGWELVPSFAGQVTVTSLADDLDSIEPGALFYPGKELDADMLRRALRRGAYAAIAPTGGRAELAVPDLPLLFADPTPAQMGALASQMAGNPSNTFAVFAVSASTPQEGVATVEKLARFLHMMGNPVGTISAGGSYSLERRLDLQYPLGIIDLQRVFAICAEDGASAVVIALDDLTIREHALESVNVDVLGSFLPAPANADRAVIERMQAEYGFRADEQMHVTSPTEESDTLAQYATDGDDPAERTKLSLAIAMVLAAGVRRSNIRNALRVAGDLQ